MSKNIPSSVLTILFANIITLAGVMYAGWNVVDIVFIYWGEGAIIGFFNFLKMVAAKDNKDFMPIDDDYYKYKPGASIIGFLIRYIVFLIFHFLVLFSIFSRFDPSFKIIDVFTKLYIALIPLFLSHLYSFVANFLLSGEKSHATFEKLNKQSFNRMGLMQAVIFFGAMIAADSGDPILFLKVFIVLKVIFDVYSHLQERNKFKPSINP